MIIIFPTFNNTNPEDSKDTDQCLQLIARYHQELIRDLLPLIESRYSTYAVSTSTEDLIASREHRLFGGFSMGGRCTWHIFNNCFSYFKYYLPLSGGGDYNGSNLKDVVLSSGYDKNDFFIFGISGSDDILNEELKYQIDRLPNESDNFFSYGTNITNGNIAYREKEGYAHDSLSVFTYIYDGLRVFFPVR